MTGQPLSEERAPRTPFERATQQLAEANREVDRLRAERDHWREEAMHARDWAAKYQEACAEVARLEAALALILQNRSGDAHAIAREALRGGGQEQPR